MEDQEREQIKISVRNLVEFILRSGDIDNRQNMADTRDAMQAGSKLHRKIQRRMSTAYHAEVPLKIKIEEDKYQLIVQGRADGIIIEEDVTIDEIKGIYADLDLLHAPIPEHIAQAKCYAYIYGIQNDLEDIKVQMTYSNLDTEEMKYFHEQYTILELTDWFEGILTEYKKWADFQYEWKKLRQASIKKMPFPFAYRTGQKELAGDVYRTIARKKNLFIQAPTGVGKTITTLYPAVKAVGEKLGDKIFYLTAKTMTGTVAKEAFDILRQVGYQAKTIQITAKEKLCKCETVECNPVNCSYAKGHYDRVNDAVFDLLQKKDTFTRDVLLEQAEAYRVCPFEMCLDVATWVDNIICDYNYVFDPHVYLKRFFAEGLKGDYIFLIDEAHNLVERGREMYSATICKEDFLIVKKIVKQYSSKMEKELNKCNKIMLAYKRECDDFQIYDNVADFIFGLMRLAAEFEKFMQKYKEFTDWDVVLKFYFAVRDFLSIYERVDEHYVIYAQHDESGSFKMKLYCVDPSFNLQQCIDKGNATIFFSATLLPIQYYKQLLSTKVDNYAVYAETAFKKEQSQLLLACDVSSKYTRRNATEYQKIAEYIYRTANAKHGNYMAFFPSYKFMQQIYEVFTVLNGTSVDCVMQETGMREDAREEFLGEFTKQRKNSMVAFCVMGGIFGEGIDLKNEQLIGAIIVGTGLPQVNNESEILKNYYDIRTGDGFNYAYRYPGMNKVLQELAG